MFVGALYTLYGPLFRIRYQCFVTRYDDTIQYKISGLSIALFVHVTLSGGRALRCLLEVQRNKKECDIPNLLLSLLPFQSLKFDETLDSLPFLAAYNCRKKGLK